ncbi:hypothetical protein [Xenorhabdus szentirmaii]|nr:MULTISPECIES: hypothetical protein [unclassified Xenorhabdus]
MNKPLKITSQRKYSRYKNINISLLAILNEQITYCLEGVFLS